VAASKSRSLGGGSFPTSISEEYPIARIARILSASAARPAKGHCSRAVKRGNIYPTGHRAAAIMHNSDASSKYKHHASGKSTSATCANAFDCPNHGNTITTNRKLQHMHSSTSEPDAVTDVARGTTSELANLVIRGYSRSSPRRWGAD